MGRINSVTVQSEDGCSRTYLFMYYGEAEKFYQKELRRFKKQGHDMKANKDFEKPDKSHFAGPDTYPMIHLFEGDPIY